MKRLSRKERQLRINANMLKVKGYKHDFNCVKFSTQNSKEHELKKAEACLDAQHKGFDFLTEVEFKQGGRADIYLPEVDYVVEILHTESEKSFDNKDYPVKRKLKFRTDEVINL